VSCLCFFAPDTKQRILIETFLHFTIEITYDMRPPAIFQCHTGLTRQYGKWICIAVSSSAGSPQDSHRTPITALAAMDVFRVQDYGIKFDCILWYNSDICEFFVVEQAVTAGRALYLLLLI
jgi:hypothetical protein